MVSFEEYQTLATRPMKKLDNAHVAMLYFSGAICGEAGEQFELVKKHVRDGTPLDFDKLTKELGDVLWYVAAVCELHNIRLEDVALTNLEKLKKRYPSGAFNASDSPRNRD